MPASPCQERLFHTLTGNNVSPNLSVKYLSLFSPSYFLTHLYVSTYVIMFDFHYFSATISIHKAVKWKHTYKWSVHNVCVGTEIDRHYTYKPRADFG